jgi:glycosyltransferase involved in cell wall biosynthesis
MADPPLVTAILPSYNAEGFIERTLECLAAQTGANLEILIGDDASTDGTVRILKGFATSRPNVRIIARNENLGWLRNSNDLMRLAGGEYFFFAFHDDVVAPTYVQALLSALQSNPGAVLAFSDLELSELDGTKSLHKFRLLEGVNDPVARATLIWRQPLNWWVPNRGLFRADAFRRIGGLKPNGAGEYVADWTWLLHMTLLGQFVRVPEVLCFKSYKPGSLSKRWSHTPEQIDALRKAGLLEISFSSVPTDVKIRILAALTGTTPKRDLTDKR